MAKNEIDLKDIAVADVLGITKEQAHNEAKRALNKLITELVELNEEEVSILDIILALMKDYNIDHWTIRSMLNRRNRYRLEKELMDKWKLVELGKVPQARYDKICKTLGIETEKK